MSDFGPDRPLSSGVLGPPQPAGLPGSKGVWAGEVRSSFCTFPGSEGKVVGRTSHRRWAWQLQAARQSRVCGTGLGAVCWQLQAREGLWDVGPLLPPHEKMSNVSLHIA